MKTSHIRLLIIILISAFFISGCNGEEITDIQEEASIDTGEEQISKNYGKGGISLDCPPPKDGYELAGFTYVLDFAVEQMWGSDMPKGGGYVFVRSKTKVKDAALEYDEIVCCVYNPITSPETQGISLECPKPKEGYYLVGFTYVMDNQVKDYWGKDVPSQGGYVYINSKTTSGDFTTKRDEIVSCVYEPYKPIITHGISINCPKPKSGYYLAGFSYMVDFRLKEAWGKDEASAEGYVYVNAETNTDNFATSRDEVTTCIFEPYRSLFPLAESIPIIDGDIKPEEWDGAMCNPIEIDGINGNVCVKTDCEDLYVMCEVEGELCNSISWMVCDNGDGIYFDKGDVGVDNEGGAFKYLGLFELEYFDSEANASCDCGAKMLMCEMSMPLDKINPINNKIYFIVGLDDLDSGWYGYSNEIEFDISTCGDTPEG